MRLIGRLLREYWLTLILCLLWAIVIWVGLIKPATLSDELNTDQLKALQPLSSDGVASDELWVLTANRDKYVTLKREEAIKFSLDKIVSSINYLFVASAAVLGFIIKILIDPLLDLTKTASKLSETVKTLLRHIAFGCILSIICGFFALAYFNDMAYSRTFSIYQELSFAALGQIAAFSISGILLVVAASAIIKSR